MNVQELIDTIDMEPSYLTLLGAASELAELVRRLIAAGALVPVPVGEMCAVWEVPANIRHVLYEGEVYIGFDLDGGRRLRDGLLLEKWDEPGEWIVQPVRLVPLAEWLK